MADFCFAFLVARYSGKGNGVAFTKPVRAYAAHPIAAAERVYRTKLYLVGESQDIFAEVTYTEPGGREERVYLYRAPSGVEPRDQAVDEAGDAGSVPIGLPTALPISLTRRHGPKQPAQTGRN
jgi:hypothetical protein